jgi:hypothetical protein
MILFSYFILTIKPPIYTMGVGEKGGRGDVQLIKLYKIKTNME